MRPNHTTNEIPYGYCHCGCGSKTTLSPASNKRRGLVKGEPLRFIHGHNNKVMHSPLSERFWANVDKRGVDECWLWRGKISKNGYGGISSESKRRYAHRISWEIHFGPIPDGLFVCHKCDVRLCQNPAHLFLGTSQDNVTDMVTKGRNSVVRPLGEGHGNAKLTDDAVREIRHLHEQGNKLTEIAALFGVTKHTIYRVVHRKGWRHLE